MKTRQDLALPLITNIFSVIGCVIPTAYWPNIIIKFISIALLFYPLAAHADTVDRFKLGLYSIVLSAPDRTDTITLRMSNNHGTPVGEKAFIMKNPNPVFSGEWDIADTGKSVSGWIVSSINVPQGCTVTIYGKENFTLNPSRNTSIPGQAPYMVSLPSSPAVFNRSYSSIPSIFNNAINDSASAATRTYFQAGSMKIKCSSPDEPLPRNYGCNRAPIALEILEDALNKTCEQFTKSDLAAITFLSFEPSSSRLESIRSASSQTDSLSIVDSLKGLTSLKTLRLVGAGITSLNKDSFDDLKSLDEVDLMENDFVLPPGVFAFNHLKSLRLTRNKLLTFNNLASLDQPTLEELSISDLPLVKLKPGFISKFPQLVKFDATNTTLDDSAGSHAKVLDEINLLSRLQQLYLSGINIGQISQDFILTLPELQTVQLGRNALKEIPPNIFSQSNKLRDASLTGNELEKLPKDLFLNAGNLKRVNLSANRLAILPDKIFAHKTKLEEVDLDENNLQTLPADIFADATALAFVRVRENELKTLPDRLFANLPLLRSVNLSVNRLSELPPFLFAGSNKITYIYLEYNKLGTLPAPILQGLTSLSHVSCIGNNADFVLPKGMENSDKVQVPVVFKPFDGPLKD